MKILHAFITTAILSFLSSMVHSHGLLKTQQSHFKHLNGASEIIFSSQQPSNQSKKLKPHLNSFFASEPLYATIHLKKPIAKIKHEDLFSDNSIIMYDLYINGTRVTHKYSVGLYKNIPENKRPYFTQEVNVNNKLNQRLTWKFNLLPIEDVNIPLKKSDKSAARAFALALLEQDIGTQHIQLNVYSRDVMTGKQTQILASGTLTINISHRDKKQLAFKYTNRLPLDHWTDTNKQEILGFVSHAFEAKFSKKPLMVGLNGSHWQQGRYKLNAQIYRKLSSWAIFPSDKSTGELPIVAMNWVSLYKKGHWTALKFAGKCKDCAVKSIEEHGLNAYLEATADKPMLNH